jgi:hypothetical protein
VLGGDHVDTEKPPVPARFTEPESTDELLKIA